MCIFAYGQTGSGKTHTMSGTDIDQYSGRGIYFRSLDDLFQLNRERRAEASGTDGCTGLIWGICRLIIGLQGMPLCVSEL